MTSGNGAQSGAHKWRFGFLGGVAIAFMALAAFVAWNQLGNFSVAVGPDGGNFTFERNDDFASIVTKTLKSDDPETKEAARTILRAQGIVFLEGDGQEDVRTVEELRRHGYFQAADLALRDKYVQMDFDESNEVQAMFLEMLWNLEGPFQKRTLAGAEETFLAAFEELHSGDADAVPPSSRPCGVGRWNGCRRSSAARSRPR